MMTTFSLERWRQHIVQIVWLMATILSANISYSQQASTVTNFLSGDSPMIRQTLPISSYFFAPLKSKQRVQMEKRTAQELDLYLITRSMNKIRFLLL